MAGSYTTPDVQLSESVRLIENSDGAVLLDIAHGTCLSMTPVGARIWQLLNANHSFYQTLDSLGAQFPDVPQQQLCDDLRAFLTDLQKNNLLRPAISSEQPFLIDRLVLWINKKCRSKNRKSISSLPRFLFWKALVSLFLYDVLGFGQNFPRINFFIKHFGVSQHLPSSETVTRVCQALNYACVWYPKRVLCLQRSAVLTCLLRSRGVTAQMVVGAQKFPFKAHAWTEVNGQSINERNDVQSTYLIWERC
jgi:hypothetical protein